MRKQSIKLNVLTSLAMQCVTILNGFIIPRLILQSFGSEVNGLVSSLSQFLNYITLLEGGVSGVILASLYKPLATEDNNKVSGIIKAANGFFKKIALVFIVYSLSVGIIYPIVVKTSFSKEYIFSLTVILAGSLFTQYFFSLTYRLLLNADRRGWIVSISQIGFIVLNLFLTLVCISVFPNIHLVKFVGLVAYITQPIVYTLYVNKHYKINKNVGEDQEALSQRWNGFSQNIAYFIHTNTDMVVLTIFSTLEEVSVYAVYFMVVNALKSLVMSISSAIAPSMGNILASKNEKLIEKKFDLYEYGIGIVTTFMFTCGVLLITPFISVYTKGVTDVNYYRPLFGLLLVIAEAVYCYRDPYVSVAYSSGHFKETAKFAYIEAGLNILVSVVLVHRYGLLGVAIGTLISMVYRIFAHVIYLQKNILHRPIKKFFNNFLFFGGIASVSVILTGMVKMEVSSLEIWIIKAIIVAAFVGVCIIVLSLFFKRQLFLQFLREIKREDRKVEQ